MCVCECVCVHVCVCLMGNYKTPSGLASAGSILLYHPLAGLSNKVQMNCNVR